MGAPFAIVPPFTKGVALFYVAMAKAAPAGYSGKPLAEKLGIKPGMKVAVVGAPANYVELLGGLPPGATMVRKPPEGAAFVHLFVKRAAQLGEHLVVYRKAIAQDGMVWVSWPKKSSMVPTDITEHVVRALALPLGFVDVKVCAVDETWTAFKLVIRLSERSAPNRRRRATP